MKLDFAIPFCKVCFRENPQYSLASLIDSDTHLCHECFLEMDPKFINSRIDEFSATSCYYYNEKLKDMIYQFKGCFDIELGELFLVNQKKYLKLKYRDYYLVPAPSFEEKNIERGFNHVEIIFQGIGKGYLKPITKKDNIKQADLNFHDRQKIGEHLLWNEKVSVRDKKILFVDDLITTGATAKACCNLIKNHGAKQIKILSLCRTKTPKKAKH